MEDIIKKIAAIVIDPLASLSKAEEMMQAAVMASLKSDKMNSSLNESNRQILI